MAEQTEPTDTLLVSGRLYKFASWKTGVALSIDRSTNIVVGNRYVGGEEQMWEAKSVNGFWTFKNPATGLFLGLQLGCIVKDASVVTASGHPFTWVVKLDDKKRTVLRAPYTSHVLDLSLGGGFADGVKVQVWNDGGNPNQRWRIDPDLTYTPPLVAGSLYKILASNNHSVAHLEGNGNVNGYEYNGGQNQKWEAIPSGCDTWYFKNHSNGKYMGIQESVVAKGHRVVSVSRPFAWDVVQRYKDGHPQKAFSLAVPYTDLHLDLHEWSTNPGTKMHLYTRTDGHWKFEEECITQCEEHIQALLFKVAKISTIGLETEEEKIC